MHSFTNPMHECSLDPELPHTLTDRDPFDRLLVSQAIVEDQALVTADRQLEAYGVEIVW